MCQFDKLKNFSFGLLVWFEACIITQLNWREEKSKKHLCRGRYPALGHFSNFFKPLLAEIWKNKNNSLKEWYINYVWKYLSKKFHIWPKAESLTPALGHTFASLYTLNKRFFSPFNQWCLFMKLKAEARTTLIMQNYLFNFVRQGNLPMIGTFLFWQKNKLIFTIKL